MYSWPNFKDKFRRHWQLGSSEIRGLIITTFFIAFIFSFRNWGTTTFDWKLGLTNYLITILLVGVSLLVHEFGCRWVATLMGYDTRYRAWLLGLVIGLVVAFFSDGHFIFLAPGAIVITANKIHKLGKFPVAWSHKQVGWIAMSGAIFNIVFAILLKGFYEYFPSDWLLKFVMINVWLTVYNMLPFPPYNGSWTFFGSRLVYTFVLGCILGASAILAFTSGILALVGAVLFGIALLAVLFFFFDKLWTDKPRP